MERWGRCKEGNVASEAASSVVLMEAVVKHTDAMQYYNEMQ